MKFKRSVHIMDRIDITPMVDVVFLLIIYFLVMSTLDESMAIEVSLPQAVKAENVAPQKPVVISIRADNRIYVGQSTVSVPVEKIADTVMKEISNAGKPADQAQVIIRGDEASQYRTIIGVMDELSLRSIKNFSLSVGKKNQGAPVK